MHLEFIAPGPPVSNQQSTSQGRANLAAWKAKVHARVVAAWAKPALGTKLKAVVINFHDGDKPSLDLDNMSKPIFDAMNNIVYEDDRQLRQVELVHLRIDAPMVIVGASKILVDAVQAGQQFVYVRVDDIVDPLPLPK
ncbi:MAG TPA: RusA family crossover junction endodeoxyribonuclease [Pirellulales bacterium]|jgi:Holliday junction resolvase RusA-like endonuclease|nr:RusA family crossover junction endodeoxyribonuclease [Pirellulales bacterium]